MGKILKALVGWILKHPEVVQAVVTAVEEHKAQPAK